MSRRKAHELEVEPGRILKHFTENETLVRAKQWIAVYAQNAKRFNVGHISFRHCRRARRGNPASVGRAYLPDMGGSVSEGAFSTA
jgi:hypothetical protein